jgi:hypothetical protein
MKKMRADEYRWIRMGDEWVVARPATPDYSGEEPMFYIPGLEDRFYADEIGPALAPPDAQNDA